MGHPVLNKKNPTLLKKNHLILLVQSFIFSVFIFEIICVDKGVYRTESGGGGKVCAKQKWFFCLLLGAPRGGGKI